MTTDNNLRQLMSNHFSKDEIKDLCFELSIDYEDLPENKGGLVRELIVHCERRGLIDVLLDECRKLRPNVEWPETSRTFLLEELLGEETQSLEYEPELVSVPAGVFLMGSPAAEDISPSEQPQHEVDLSYYRIGKYPVTNAQYAAYIKSEPKQNVPIKAGWFLRQPPADKLDHPVVGVTWYDAQAYCQWLAELTGKPYRLPTEAEWEKAARGSEGFLYPWGNEWQEGRCNVGGGQTAPVTDFPSGESPFGCLDLLGNVQEWTSTLWGDDRQQPSYTYPYQANDGRENLADDPQRPRLRRVHRGGSYNSDMAQLRCAVRSHDRPGSASIIRGFRVVVGPG